MTESEFRAKRRQKFLTEKYFVRNGAMEVDNIASKREAIAQGRLPVSDTAFAAVRGGAFKSALKLLRLHYTAGEPIESLKPLYAAVLHWFDEWHSAHRTYIAHLAQESGDDLRTDGTPARFDDLFHFQLVLDVLSVGILLGEADSVRKAAAWLERYRGTDMLVEFLLENIVPDPRDIEKFWHVKPYDPLLDAIYTADTPEEAAAYVKKYLDGWYPAFKGVPWHNGHLVQTEEYSNYEGYWAFEAAAVCVLKGIDDSSFRDHLVYPKDLADWARAQKVTEAIRWRGAPEGEQPLRCEAGQPCPKAGWWFAPADPASRRHFKTNELMPELPSAYGKTIWQFDTPQSDSSAT